MKKINEKSKIVLDKLWKYATQNNGYHKLNNDPTFMSLTIEILDNNQISLCHYGEQNGDLMRDPEMVFWKDENGNYFPFYFRNDYVGLEEFSGEIIDKKLVINNVEKQKNQIEFVDIWMENIKYQQGIK
jgi:hypothetical protein